MHPIYHLTNQNNLWMGFVSWILAGNRSTNRLESMKIAATGKHSNRMPTARLPTARVSVATIFQYRGVGILK